MGFSIFSNGNKINYNIKNYVADTINDLTIIPKSAPGSMVFVIENSTYYILNNQYQWIKKENDENNDNNNIQQPTGAIDITENGTNINIAQYATANVAVPIGVFPQGSIGLTNPLLIYDVTNYANAYIDIPSVEESEW